MAKTYVVKAPTALVYLEGRKSAVTLAKGGVLPVEADTEHVKLLLERGIIEEGEAVGGVESDPDAAPPFTAPAGGEGSGSSGQRASSYDGTSAPAKSGSKSDWLDWAARVEGVAPDSDEAKALGEMTRDGLVDAYADKTPAS